ncbi:MAG: response regulator [Acidobacteriota bacterium]|nr:response regulator [Acidobacteriota bacterium]
MTSLGELRRENEVLGQRVSKLTERISTLSEASLRIGASLEVRTVLREVVDTARALTGARYGVIVTIDEQDQVQDYVTSGFNPDEQQQFKHWADGLRVFEHFRDLPGALRLNDLPSYVRSLGYSPGPLSSCTFQCTPVRHHGVDVGNFFVCGKEDGREFTSEDEEVLVMFAAQAALAIANARAYRDEKRTRSDMEALIDTSPVGVAVFDAKTGETLSLNQEAKRIVEGLRAPGGTLEQMREDLICLRADGQEISLQASSLTQTLQNATRIRAEEIVLRVPDDRSIKVLMNVTPIRAENGTVESVVATVQDLEPMEELERLRAEFLGMVSHELRAPLISIKGSTTTALSTQPAPNLAEILQIIRIIDEQADHMRSLISDLLDAGHIESGTLSVSPEPTEVASLVDQARTTLLSGGSRHAVKFDVPLDLPRVMADRQRIVQVINNLLSNAAQHSPESVPIRIAAVREDVHVAISIADEGRGVPPDLLPHLFRKHVRADERHGIRGSGLGLAICKGLVEAHGGRIWAESDGDGLGARFTFTIPVAADSVTGTGVGLVRSSSHPPRTDRERTRILVVDDDPQTLRYVRDALTAAGYAPLVTADPREVPRLIQANRPGLVLLDLVLPGMDGIELMQNIPEMADLPVIFISAYGRSETIAKALDMGGVDYIVKPFSTTELVARIHAALRRRKGSDESFRLGDLAINYEERQVTLAGIPVQLTATQYELLRMLSVNAGRVMKYESLLQQVWGRREFGDVRPLRAFIKMIRRKLGDDATNPAYIFTVRQVGYRMPKPRNP